jgi:hypothetical protein
MKIVLLILGALSAVLIVAQLVMGQLILMNKANANYPLSLVKAHQHSGYMAVAVTLTYLVLSLITIASMPKREKR